MCAHSGWMWWDVRAYVPCSMDALIHTLSHTRARAHTHTHITHAHPDTHPDIHPPTHTVDHAYIHDGKWWDVRAKWWDGPTRTLDHRIYVHMHAHPTTFCFIIEMDSFSLTIYMHSFRCRMCVYMDGRACVEVMYKIKGLFCKRALYKRQYYAKAWR